MHSMDIHRLLQIRQQKNSPSQAQRKYSPKYITFSGTKNTILYNKVLKTETNACSQTTMKLNQNQWKKDTDFLVLQDERVLDINHN